ncbi:phosphatase PAP2 family protein [Microbacterium betulae]|uniref:Phosphatase PAP2 family protein n=1 Tax=Microbacterium betulae TaxID=2981139 RepID=A0AA97FJ79_9MICO|nr:phosphatase PAP2 family protein [Microbacterium sp. AB]WOF23733.1 phosphatase PAP2 family protein [Microbacterium sp. AB]
MMTSRSARAWWGAGMIAAAIALGLGTMLRGIPFAVDAWWADVLSSPPGGGVLTFSLLLDGAGGGWIAVFVVPPGIALVLFLVGRRWGALYFVATSAASALLVQALKHLFARARPEDILVVVDEGSFPSGHVANAATVGIALWILFPRWWTGVIAAAWIVAMAFSRTYLSAHWASDTLGGALVGTGVALAVAAAMTPLRERDRARDVARL